MLAVVVIGADDTVRETFEAWTKEGATVRFYDTAEEAHYDLVDAEATESAKLRELATAAREAGSLPSEAAAGALHQVADRREPSMMSCRTFISDEYFVWPSLSCHWRYSIRPSTYSLSPFFT